MHFVPCLSLPPAAYFPFAFSPMSDLQTVISLEQGPYEQIQILPTKLKYPAALGGYSMYSACSHIGTIFSFSFMHPMAEVWCWKQIPELILFWQLVLQLEFLAVGLSGGFYLARPWPEFQKDTHILLFAPSSIRFHGLPSFPWWEILKKKKGKTSEAFTGASRLLSCRSSPPPTLAKPLSYIRLKQIVVQQRWMVSFFHSFPLIGHCHISSAPSKKPSEVFQASRNWPLARVWTKRWDSLTGIHQRRKHGPEQCLGSVTVRMGNVVYVT